MMKTRQIYWRILFAIIVVFILLHIYFFFETNESTEWSTRTLDNDGFCCFKVDDRHTKVEDRHTKVGRDNEQKETLKRLPPNYEFLDYEYTIYSTALSTFHRDVTSSQVLYNCKYPVYTLIVYEYGGDLLSICPASERTWPFVWTRIVNLSGQQNTCILFNSEILHAGQPNECRPRLTRQYKICHKDDIKNLQHLVGVRAKKDIECVDDLSSRIKRKISYYFAFSINHLLYPFLMQKWREDTWIGQMQKLLPDNHQFYNNI
jgi:hypothetical protein